MPRRPAATGWGLGVDISGRGASRTAGHPALGPVDNPAHAAHAAYAAYATPALHAVYTFTDSLRTAIDLVVHADAQLAQVVALSLRVSATACLIGAAVGLAAGAALAVWRFPGRALVVGVLNTLLALPSVVVGLSVYLLL